MIIIYMPYNILKLSISERKNFTVIAQMFNYTALQPGLKIGISNGARQFHFYCIFDTQQLHNDFWHIFHSLEMLINQNAKSGIDLSNANCSIDSNFSQSNQEYGMTCSATTFSSCTGNDLTSNAMGEQTGCDESCGIEANPSNPSDTGDTGTSQDTGNPPPPPPPDTGEDDTGDYDTGGATISRSLYQYLFGR